MERVNGQDHLHCACVRVASMLKFAFSINLPPSFLRACVVCARARLCVWGCGGEERYRDAKCTTGCVERAALFCTRWICKLLFYLHLLIGDVSSSRILLNQTQRSSMATVSLSMVLKNSPKCGCDPPRSHETGGRQCFTTDGYFPSLGWSVLLNLIRLKQTWASGLATTTASETVGE